MKLYTKMIIGAMFIFTIFSVSLLPSATSWAADPPPAVKVCTDDNTYICKTNKENLTSDVLKPIISILLYVAGTIAVIMIIVGAIRYITSDGDASKAATAKNTIIYAVVGLVVAVMSFGIVTFVVGRL